MPPSDQSRLSAGSTIADLRVVFTLVPWRMRWRIIAMAVAALLAAMLDLVAVAAMLPLTQMLTAPDPLPGAVDRFLVPLAGTDPRRLLILTAVAVGAAFLVKNVAVIAIRWWSIGQSNRASAAVQAELLRRYAAARYVDHRMRSKSAMTNMVGGAVPAAFSMVLSSWLALPGATARIGAGTALDPDQIAAIEIRSLSSGRVLMRSELETPGGESP